MIFPKHNIAFGGLLVQTVMLIILGVQIFSKFMVLVLRFILNVRKYIYYPLAQQSCGVDLGSVPYVCTYVRSYVHLLSSL